MNKRFGLLLSIFIAFACASQVFSMNWVRSWWSGEGQPAPVGVEQPAPAVEPEDDEAAFQRILRESEAAERVRQQQADEREAAELRRVQEESEEAAKKHQEYQKMRSGQSAVRKPLTHEEVQAILHEPGGEERLSKMMEEQSLAEIYPMKLWNEVSQDVATCDALNKDYEFVNESDNPKISQVPCLYQSYPGLPENYCGYYAAYFALCMMSSRSDDEMRERLNDRAVFNVWLKIWIDVVKNAVKERETQAFYSVGENFIGLVEIKEVIIPTLAGLVNIGNIFVEGYDFSRADFSKPDSRIMKAISKFNQAGGDEKLCFIYNTSSAGSHWLTILVTKDGRLIIADPLAKNRTVPEFDYIKNLYNAVFGR